MAEHAQASTVPQSLSFAFLEDNHASAKHSQLREACNYRDLSGGHQCGCATFWFAENQPTRLDTSDGTRSAYDWCVCGHHACYHAVSKHGGDAAQPYLSPLPPHIVQRDGQWYMRLTPISNGPHTQQSPGQTSLEKGQTTSAISRSSAVQYERAALESQDPALSELEKSGLKRVAEYNETHPGPSSNPGSAPDLNHPHQSMSTFHQEERRSTSGQAAEQLSVANLSALNSGNHATRIGETGLGLSVQSSNQISAPAIESHIASTIPVVSNSLQSSTRPSSSSGNIAHNSPSRAFLQAVSAARSLPQIEMPRALPPQINADDIVQSATEIATPSNSNTPELRGVDEPLAEAQNLLDVIIRASSNRHTSSSPAAHFLVAGSPAAPQDTLKQLIKMFPVALRELINLFNSVKSSQNENNNLWGAVESRLNRLENASFHHITPEELENKFDNVDARLLDVETWKDEHDRNASRTRSNDSNGNNDQLHDSNESLRSAGDSFRSNGSAKSEHTRSASSLFDAAFKHIDDIKVRLEDLEDLAPPSVASPWEIEVVFLPWGRELRGIWYPSDEGPSGTFNVGTVDSEEWTQNRSFRSMSHASLQAPEHGSSAWSSQAIHAWADGAHERFSPKACGPKNIVYQRLESRGFVRKVKISSSNAGDIQMSLKTAFQHIVNDVGLKDGDNSCLIDDPSMDKYPALKTTFIPLRKIPKSRKLQFLRPCEMSTSALWTAQFLASGIFMRVPGGQRRLFLTNGAAYLQMGSDILSSWTWPRLREMQRVCSDELVPHDGHVGEADAMEACWKFNQAFDPPISVSSSFASESSMQSAVPEQPAVQSPEHQSTPSEQVIAALHNAPISPLSEFIRNDPPRQHRYRTVSAPLTDENAMIDSTTPQSRGPRALGKRRNASFEASERSSGFTTVPAAPLSSLSKRRRRTHSPGIEHYMTMQPWAFTPRRSKEPPSPFIETRSGIGSEGGTATSASLVFAPMKKRGTTPFAYATPYSGSALLSGLELPEDIGLMTDGDTELVVDEATVKTEMDLDRPSGERERADDDRGDGESWQGLVGDDDDGAADDVDEDEMDAQGGAHADEADDDQHHSEDDNASGFADEDDLYD